MQYTYVYLTATTHFYGAFLLGSLNEMLTPVFLVRFYFCCHFPSYNCILKICDDEIHSAHNTFARTFSHTAATHRNIVREHFITFLFCHSEGLLIYVCICVRMRVRVVCVCICVNRIVRESSNMATIHDTW